MTEPSAPSANRGMRVSTITVKSGLVLELPKTVVLCVVGGNNVGKSQFLREVQQSIVAEQPTSGFLVDSVSVQFEFAGGDISGWLEEHGVQSTDPNRGVVWAARGLEGSSGHRLEHLQQWVSNPRPYLTAIADWFIRALDSGRRVGLATGSLGIAGMLQPMGGPLYELWLDGDRESEFSDICMRTFGFPLTLDRVTGNVQLRVGTPSVETPPLQHPTREYTDAVANLPPVADQGDGVKNYLGMVLHLMTAHEAITIIDEPEAFLHPAQARALGRHLGQQAVKQERQLLTATHDRDFVLGLLEANCPVLFLRINRAGNTNSFAPLLPEDVQAIWDKPALRYSNLIQGLFHQAVVVCEGDPDCRWYAAVLDHLASQGTFSAEEVLFVPGGGKDQVPASLHALDSLQVQSFGLLDFDVLYDTSFIKRLALARQIPEERLLLLSRAIRSQLSTTAMRKRAKETGIRGLPAGNCATMADEMISILRSHRILVVEAGELESFDNTIGGHASAWVSEALARGIHKSSTEARAVLAPVIAALNSERAVSPLKKIEAPPDGVAQLFRFLDCLTSE